MKKHFAYFLSFLFVVATLVAGCTASREQEDEAEDELAEFRTWVSNKTANIADRTEEDWQKAKEDFKTRTQELDQKQEQFTDALKQEYQQLKQEFRDADDMYGRSRQEKRANEWERNLLGRWADMATINENNVGEVYVHFLAQVREKKGSWHDADWEMAEQVLERLNARKKAITGDIPTDTEVKIRALQMEFRTLETAADARDHN